MKRFSLILMAFAMVMGMTQCKKENTTANTDPVYDGPMTEITLTLSNGSSNRSEVNPQNDGTAHVKFNSTNDRIEVAYKGKWVGTLYYNTSSSTHDKMVTLWAFLKVLYWWMLPRRVQSLYIFIILAIKSLLNKRQEHTINLLLTSAISLACCQ